MSVGQLYILNPCIRYERQTTVHRIMFLGQPLSPNPFGGAYLVAVNHMRLEQVDLSKLVVDKIDDKTDNLQQLRILVICSPLEDTDDHMADQRARNTTPAIPRDTDFLEGQIVSQIAKQDLRSLGAIVIDHHKFWISGNAEGDQSRPVWFLQRATEEP